MIKLDSEKINTKYKISMDAINTYCDHLTLNNHKIERELERIDYYQSETNKSLKRISRLKIFISLFLVLAIPMMLTITISRAIQCLA